jgi:ornithine decarboxylase
MVRARNRSSPPMSVSAPIWATPEAFLAAERPEAPTLLFAPAALTASARRFLDGFPGLTSYAVKANPEPAVILGLAAAGVRAFDVASAAEVRLLRRLVPEAALHYHNPVKARGEIAYALGEGVRTFALDSMAELDKLAAAAGDVIIEASVRFRLPVSGAAYDFGAKFGADPDRAADLLRAVAARGWRPSLTFHPGTQCEDPAAWTAYIHAAAEIARAAGVCLHRLNVGGGFPAGLYGPEPDLAPYFTAIAEARDAAFGDAPPPLVCEPGRALASGCMALAAQVTLVREDGAVFLNDGVYGGMDEMRVLGRARRARALTPDGAPRESAPRPTVVFGPTCDSVDRLPGALALPETLREGDYLLFDGLGAYGSVTTTGFNGYGALATALVSAL